MKEATHMPLSARNRLDGEITDVLLGTVTALVTVKVGNNVIESVITKRSAEEIEPEERRQGDRRDQSN